MQAGVGAVQLRERDLDDTTFVSLCLKVLHNRIGRVPVLLNRKPHLVARCGADGIQIGSSEISRINRFRRVMPEGAIVGVSCHSGREIQQAYEAGADFATISPMFPTASKPEATSFVSVEQVALWQRQYRMPLVALGGIGLEEARLLKAYGINRVACIRSVLACASNIEVLSNVLSLRRALGLI